MTIPYMLKDLTEQHINEEREVAKRERRATVVSSARRVADKDAITEGASKGNPGTRVMCRTFADGLGGRLLRAVIQPEVLAVLRSDHQTLQAESLRFLENEINRAYLALGPPPGLDESSRGGRFGGE
jgi:hypothetical protein